MQSIQNWKCTFTNGIHTLFFYNKIVLTFIIHKFVTACFTDFILSSLRRRDICSSLPHFVIAIPYCSICFEFFSDSTCWLFGCCSLNNTYVCTLGCTLFQLTPPKVSAFGTHKQAPYFQTKPCLNHFTLPIYLTWDFFFIVRLQRRSNWK